MTYEEIYHRYAKEVYNSIYRIVQHTGEAEDLLQETFLEAFEDLDYFFSRPEPSAWLKRVGINKSITLLRKRKLLHIVGKDDFPDINVEAIDEQEFELEINHVMQAIQQLPLGYRTIVQLYLIEDIPQEEIGQMLGIAHGTVRSQYFRARKQIISLIQKMKING